MVVEPFLVPGVVEVLSLGVALETVDHVDRKNHLLGTGA